jgi:hypothetical protein
MDALEQKRVQAEAAVRLAKKRVASGVWKEIRLIEAQAELNACINQPTDEPEAQTIKFDNGYVIDFSKAAPRQGQGVQRGVNFAEMPKAKELVAAARASRKELAELSNRLHNTEGRELVLLLREIGVKQLEKERKWSAYYRYKETGEVATEVVFGKAESNPAMELELKRLEDEKDSEMQKRARAKNRLENEPLSEQQRIKQEEKWSKHEMNVKDLQERIKQIKNG